MGIRRIAVALVALSSLVPQLRCSSSWSDPSNPQYHIQTDEGPERYFRYQTLNGQYRKEKRLEDGTVVGTYAWIDDDGYLIQRDYIADNAGYRILKSKNLFVGRDMPVAQAMILARKFPASTGTLVKPGSIKLSGTKAPSSPGIVTPQFAPPVVAKYTTPIYGYPASVTGFSPQVDISPNSIPSSTESPIAYASTPSSTVLPPYSPSTTPKPDVIAPSTTPATVYIPSTTPSTVYIPSPSPPTEYIPSSTPPPAYVHSTTPSGIPFESSTRRYVTTTTQYSEETFRTGTLPASTPDFRRGPPQLYIPQPTPSTLPPPIQSNSLDYYSGAPQYEQYDETVANPYVFHNGPTYPIDKRGQAYTGQRDNNYDSQYKEYDGVSVTNDGFRYYIPRAYHEEENLPDNKKSGSFGYIDPFGIRRVVYYNASPEKGFQHRKNNRYVGFNATPYDPRPV